MVTARPWRLKAQQHKQSPPTWAGSSRRRATSFAQCAVQVGKLSFTNWTDPGEGLWDGWTFRSYHDGSVTYEYQGRWYDAGRWAAGGVPSNEVTNSYLPPNVIRSYDEEMTVAGCTLKGRLCRPQIPSHQPDVATDLRPADQLPYSLDLFPARQVRQLARHAVAELDKVIIGERRPRHLARHTQP